MPHPGQVKAGHALFTEQKHRIFLQCGRKWGKSEFVLYALTRWAILNPNSTCSYYAPTRKNAKLIIWNRLKRFIPIEFLKDHSVERAFKEQELTVRLWNGSEITVDGTDSEEAGRGVEPHVVVYDEFKDFKKGFHEGMEPNLEVHDAPIIFIGTPPDQENQFTAMATLVKADPQGFYLELPSSEGPIYGTEKGLTKLQKIKQECIDRGDLSYFYREYEARFVLGGAGSVFPMWNKLDVTRSPEQLKDEVSKDILKMDWVNVSDPGSSSVFASLLVSRNPYNHMLYILDEVYEKNPMKTSTRQIWPEIEKMCKSWNKYNELTSSKWSLLYDQAARWFANEVFDNYKIFLSPTDKVNMDNKDNGLSLIKDQLLAGKVKISTKCVWLIWEIEQYVKDKNGNIPKKNDHLIDAWRYANAALGYRFENIKKEEDPFQKAGWRGVRIADEFDLEDMLDDY